MTLKFIVLGLIFSSCSSNEIPLAEQNQQNPVQLLRAVQSGSTITSYKYNSDFTLNSIKVERNGKLHSESKFSYQNGKVSQIIWKDVLGKSEIKRVFEYNGELLVKATAFKEQKIVTIEEYYYNGDNELIKQIQKLEWDDPQTKQTRVIDIHKVPGKNEVQLTYNGRLSFIITYDDKENPYANIKGYAKIRIAHDHGITNNILSIKSVYKSGTERTQTHELVFDANGKHLTEVIKKENNQRLIGTDVYTYK